MCKASLVRARDPLRADLKGSPRPSNPLLATEHPKFIQGGLFFTLLNWILNLQ